MLHIGGAATIAVGSGSVGSLTTVLTGIGLVVTGAGTIATT